MGGRYPPFKSYKSTQSFEPWVNITSDHDTNTSDPRDRREKMKNYIF